MSIQLDLLEPNIQLRRVMPTDYDDATTEWLIKACAPSYMGVEPIDIVRRHEFFMVLRVTGAADGIVILQKLSHPAGVEAEIWGLAGQNMVWPIANARKILHELSKIARYGGARWLASNNIHPKLDRVYKKLIPKHSTKYMMEI